MLLGILAILVSFLPFIQVIVFALGPATVIYAGIGIRRAMQTGVGGAAAAWGLVLGTIALAIAVLLGIGFTQR